MSPAEQGGFTMAMGPMSLSFADFVSMRLNEHVLHTWDVEVSADPAATLPPDVAAFVVDNLGLVARFTAKPTGDATTITVATTEPARFFLIKLAPDSATLAPAEAPDSADLTLPAEAFARLVYGRLDAEHTPAGLDSSALDLLRQVFPGP